MSEKIDRIVNYEPTMAKQTAEMFNEFNKLWPGGFGGGVPYTEQRVHDWLDKTSAIADLIAIDQEDELVGYCGLYPHWRDKNAAYISILGVTPKAKGKKFGKRLLLKALELAEEHGIFRVDLHTWSGNLEAVPLYKKIGLFWVPETSVYMQNYIPGILQTELAKTWFEKHKDWYGNFKRELHQIPDKQIAEGMETYTYKFEVDNDSFVAEIDRYGWGFCHLERILDEKKISAKTRLSSHDIFIGIPNTLTVTLQNDYENEIEAKLDIKEFKGLKWKEEFPKTVIVKKDESIQISREFVIDKSAKLFRDNDRACESIFVKINLGDNVIELSTSGKIQSAVKLRSINENRFSTAPVGSEVKIPMDVLNTTKTTIEGFAHIEIEGIKDSSIKIPIKIKPEEIIGINIPITIPATRKTNKFIIKTTPTIQYNGHEIEMPTYDIPVFAKTNDLIELVELKDRNMLFFITDKLTVRAMLEGGNLRIFQQENNGLNPLNHQTGPPYGLSLDRTLLHEYELIEEGRYKTLILTGKSIHVPGLVVKKHIKISPGMNEIEYWVTYRNVDKKSIHASARTSTGFQGISLNPYTAKGKAFTPIGGKIYESDTFTNFLTDPLLPTEPQFWSETWTAVEGLMLGDYSAWIWKPEKIEKIKLRQGHLSQLESKTEEIQPGETYKPVHLWYSFGYNMIHEIRNRWNQLVGNIEFDHMESTVGPKLSKALEVELSDKTVLTAGETVKKTFLISLASAYPLQGSLSLKLPKNWKGNFIVDGKKASKIEMPKLEPFKSSPIDIELVVPEKINSPIENIILHFSGEFEIDFDNQILVTEKGSVEVQEKMLDGKKVIEVSNGALDFKVVADIGGNLIRLEDSKKRSFLLDGYPEVKPKFFLEHYLGGIQPAIFHLVSDDPFAEMEETKSVVFEDGMWKGVKTIWTIKKEKQYLFGQKVELQYLTIPNSEVIRVILTLHNKTSRSIPWIGSLISDIGLQGSKEGNVIEVKGTDDLWIRNSVKKQFISQGSFNKPYSRITKGNQSISFVVPTGSHGSSVVADLGVMLLKWALGLQYTKPNSSSSMEFAIMINQPREKMEELRFALGK